MNTSQVLTIQEAMELTQDIPEIFAQILDLFDAEVEFVELGVKGDQILVREVEKSNPTVSSVHVPSTEWNKDNLLLSKAMDDEKRYTLAPWYVPDVLDAHDEWTDKEEVQRAFWDYLSRDDRSIRLQHNMDIVAGEWVEGLTWPHAVTVPIKHPDGDKEITFPAGTPFLGVVWQPWAWQLIKDGEIRGLSIGGRGKRMEADPEDYEYDPMGKVTFTKMIQTEGDKFVVYSDDGSKTFGTYGTRDEAEERLRQIEYFGKADFKSGDFVSWNSSGGRATGQIERIEIDGDIKVPDSSFTITGTNEEPAALITVWREDSDGWNETNRKVGHKLDALTPIDALQKAETFKPPQAVIANAKRALEWISEGKAGSGFTDVGRRRASQLANGQAVSLETIKRIYSFLSRHEGDSKAEGFERGEKNYPSAGRVSWDAWGGDAAIAWSRSISERFEKHLPGKHDQQFHGRGGYTAVAQRRKEQMDNVPKLTTDADGRIANADATGGYLANIPETISLPGFEHPLTPRDSAWHHAESDGEGGFKITKERTLQHEKIINDTVSKVPSSENPTFVMLGGGPASGKSTFIRETGMIADRNNAVHVNADDMKSELPEFNRMRNAFNDQEFFHAAGFSHEESSYLAEVARKSAMAQSKPIVLDGTGNGNYEKFAGKIQEAKANGFRVEGNYVTVPTDVAVTRAFNRSLKASERRFVPQGIVEKTHAAVSTTFPRAVADGLFDSFSLWDTNSPSPKKLVEGTGTALSIIDNVGYQAFLDKGN